MADTEIKAAEGTIAYELENLALAKDNISSALERAATGATEGFKFNQYGEIIDSLFAVKTVINSYDEEADAMLYGDTLGEFVLPGRVSCYYIDQSLSYDKDGNHYKFNDCPSDFKDKTNFWLLSTSILANEFNIDCASQII